MGDSPVKQHLGAGPVKPPPKVCSIVLTGCRTLLMVLLFFFFTIFMSLEHTSSLSKTISTDDTNVNHEDP